MAEIRDGFDLGYPSSRYKPWKGNEMDKEDGWNALGDGKFDNRILNPNVEDPNKPDPDYGSTLESHLWPFGTALAMSCVVVLVALALTPLPQLRSIFGIG